jgi:hypothetical protein
MKLLLDENLPKKLKLDFSQHEVYAVTEMGWNGVKNGDLLTLMTEAQFDALLTFDKKSSASAKLSEIQSNHFCFFCTL